MWCSIHGSGSGNGLRLLKRWDGERLRCQEVDRTRHGAVGIGSARWESRCVLHTIAGIVARLPGAAGIIKSDDGRLLLHNREIVLAASATKWARVGWEGSMRVSGLGSAAFPSSRGGAPPAREPALATP